jgi:mono/diheme cytochrome c family protein
MEPRTRSSSLRRRALLALVALAALVVLAAPGCGPGDAGPAVAPARLSETGLYTDASCDTLAPGVRAFSPQYPLWSDGARKRRWVYLPDGTTIDASDPYRWSFPVGTKFWKEFRFARRAETRYIERVADGEWLYATYVWPEDGGEAVLAPEQGVRGACETELGTRHDIPAVADCRACHEGTPSRVLGFSALQLASLRDPAAPHAEMPEPHSLGLEELLASGRLAGSPAAILDAARPIEARSARERAALGYLHANCGGCHNPAGPLATLGLELEYRHEDVAPALRTALAQASQYQPTGAHDALRLVPGEPDESVLYRRAASRFGATQMPPLGTHAVDEDALALLRDWIRSDLAEPVTVADRLSPDVRSSERLAANGPTNH